MKVKVECRNCGGNGYVEVHVMSGKIMIIDCGFCEGKGSHEVEVEDCRTENHKPIDEILEDLQ